MSKLKKPTFNVDKEKLRDNIRRGIILFIVGVFVVGGVGVYIFTLFTGDSSTSQVQNTPEPEPTQVDPEFIVDEPITKLEKIDITTGSGATVKEGDTVMVNYKGALAATGEVFDESAEPLELNLEQVIPGWQQGVPGMKEGGKRRLVVPAELGYGAVDMGTIPPNSDLVFELEVIEVVKE